MGLKLAIKLHGEGNIELAEKHYLRALKQKSYHPSLFQNYGALLRKRGDKKKAYQIYDAGLKLFPDSREILLNRANLDLEECPTSAIRTYLRLLHDDLINSSDQEILQSSLQRCVSALRELGMPLASFLLLKNYSRYIEFNGPLVMNLLLLLRNSELRSCLQLDTNTKNLALSKNLFALADREVVDYPFMEQVELRFSLASCFLQLSMDAEASFQYKTGTELINNLPELSVDDREKLQTIVTVHSWNYSCSLLKNQDFAKGWKLFDYGLLTPAPGPQRWQRSLSKPFDNDELPVLKHQNIHGKRLLLLEEQGVGDAMQFLTLLPSILDKVQYVGICLCKRLLSVYTKSFSDEISSGKVVLHLFEHVLDNSLKYQDYDYQLPMGSLPQLIEPDPCSFHPKVPILKTDDSKASELKNQYLSKANSIRKIVGISWRGGGKADRIKMKSPPEDDFLKIISGFPDILFVSLQYGESGKTIEKWSKTIPNIVYDSRFNPLKNLDEWLIQVKACDAVLSVANTTIHGAGGLNIPTLCLLSKHADWRWFSSENVDTSYWYPSVGIARQSSNTISWNSVISQSRKWLSQSCPLPKGVFTG